MIVIKPPGLSCYNLKGHFDADAGIEVLFPDMCVQNCLPSLLCLSIKLADWMQVDRIVVPVFSRDLFPGRESENLFPSLPVCCMCEGARQEFGFHREVKRRSER